VTSSNTLAATPWTKKLRAETMANSGKILFFTIKGAKRELFAFVVCAQFPLDLCQSASPPLMPFLIRDDVSHGWQVTPAEYLQFLRHKQSVEVHDLGLELPAQGRPQHHPHDTGHAV
jgi:hypothetical protein